MPFFFLQRTSYLTPRAHLPQSVPTSRHNLAHREEAIGHDRKRRNKIEGKKKRFGTGIGSLINLYCWDCDCVFTSALQQAREERCSSFRIWASMNLYCCWYLARGLLPNCTAVFYFIFSLDQNEFVLARRNRRCAYAQQRIKLKIEAATAFPQTLGGHLHGRPEVQILPTPRCFSARQDAAASPCVYVSSPLQ